MPTTVTPSPSWPAVIQTFSDADLATGANFLTYTKQLADALAALQLGSLGALDKQSGARETGVFARLAGEIHVIGQSASNQSSIAERSWSALGTTSGGSNAAVSVSTESEAMLSYNGNVYWCDTGGAWGGAQAVTNNAPADAAYSPYNDGRWLLVGRNSGTSASHIERTADPLTAWTSAFSNVATNVRLIRVAVSNDLVDSGRYCLAAYQRTSGSNVNVEYSSDGGVTWSSHAHGLPSSGSCVGIAYDALRARWVMAYGQKVYTAPRDTLTTWTERATLVGTEIKDLHQLGQMLVAISYDGGLGVTWLLYSFDGGSTWSKAGTVADAARLWVSDGHLIITGGSSYWVSRRLV